MPKRILVVAHDEPLRRSRVHLLEFAGYEVESVDSSDRAMTLLETGHFDLVVLGRKSVQSKNSTAQRIRENYPDLLTLKIEDHSVEDSFFVSRITDSAPEHVLAALREMLAGNVRLVLPGGSDQAK